MRTVSWGGRTRSFRTGWGTGVDRGAGLSDFNTWSLQKCERKANGKCFNAGKKIQVIISGGSNTRFLETWVLCLIIPVFSHRHDLHSFKHTFFHKNQWASHWDQAASENSSWQRHTESQNKARQVLFSLFLKEKNLQNSICKCGFVKNISDCRINWRVHQRKDGVFRESSDFFFLRVGAGLHKGPLAACFSPSLGPKSGRWERTGQGSEYSLLLGNDSRMLEKGYSASPTSGHFDERCTNKREHWIVQRFTELATQRISFATLLPNPPGTGEHRQQHGQAAVPGTSMSSVEQQIARTPSGFFANNILHLPTGKICVSTYIFANCYSHVLHVATKSTAFSSFWSIWIFLIAERLIRLTWSNLIWGWGNREHWIDLLTIQCFLSWRHRLNIWRSGFIGSFIQIMETP